MVVYRRETGTRTVLFILVMLAIALISVDSGGNGVVASIRGRAHDLLSPVQSAVNSAFQPVRDVTGGITSYGSVKDENARLRRQIADLRGQLRRNKGSGSELGQLQRLLDLPTVEDASGIAARVSGGSPGNFERTVELNKGSDKGIRVGYPVVTGDGLVGKITQVAHNTATVTLIDSPTIGLGARLETSHVFGITQTKAGDRTLTLGFLSDPSILPPKGELVLTAAVANAAFPPDEPVGTVTSVHKGAQDLQPTITITPLVDLNSLDFVKVLRWPDNSATPVGG